MCQENSTNVVRVYDKNGFRLCRYIYDWIYVLAKDKQIETDVTLKPFYIQYLHHLQ